MLLDNPRTKASGPIAVEGVEVALLLEPATELSRTGVLALPVEPDDRFSPVEQSQAGSECVGPPG